MRNHLAILFSLCIVSPVLASPISFRVTYRPDSFVFGDNPDYFWYSFTKSGSSSFTISSQGTDNTFNFGTIDFAEKGLTTGTTARVHVSVSAIGTSSSGQGDCTLIDRASAFDDGQNKIYISPVSPSSTTVSFAGGSVTIGLQINPISNWIYDGTLLKMQGTTSFALSDPAVTISATQPRFNTAVAGGSASASRSSQVTQSAQAFVDSVTLDYGDGSNASLAFTQASALTFTTTASHSFALASGQDSRAFTVTATAYGPADNSSDDDQDSKNVVLTLLRSPLAMMSLDGVLIPSGSVLEVTPGQVLSFEGSPALGFIEEAILKLHGTEILSTTSPDGLADEALSGLLTFPDLPPGSELLLEYFCTNTGYGLNSNTWSATLEVVPEPATLSLLVLGGVALLRRHQRQRVTR
jgi:hypothetical protein